MNKFSDHIKKSKNLKKRYKSEKLFKFYGLLAIMLSFLVLGLLFYNIISKGYNAFFQTYIHLELDIEGNDLTKSSVKKAIYARLGELVPHLDTRKEKKLVRSLVSRKALSLSIENFIEKRHKYGSKISLLASDEVDHFIKKGLPDHIVETRRFNKKSAGWVKDLKEKNIISKRFNLNFFTHADSSVPELAGIWGAVVGSFFTMMVTLLFSFPIAVAAGVYLEEFAPKNIWTDLIEVNINNLAAVPSIIFGLLGLAIFLQFFGLPRSAPVLGGLVLGLMTLPAIIIATRVSLKSVPMSIRHAALGVGASPMQAVFHHALPLALPGIFTGTIIGMARALGETAPLIMIGMVAFITDIPKSPLDSSSALPVQIFLWADKPEIGFVAKTSGAILILLLFLIIMNGTAIFLRKRFERRW